MRLALFSAVALLVFGCATTPNRKLCPVHGAPMTQKQVMISFIVDRLNVEEWQAYTKARARLFPYSCDDIETNVEELPFSKKTGEIEWQKVPTNAWIYVCPVCDERKLQWQAEHPPRNRDAG